MRRAIRVLGLILLAAVPSAARADEPGLQGEWKTSLETVTFKEQLASRKSIGGASDGVSSSRGCGSGPATSPCPSRHMGPRPE